VISVHLKPDQENGDQTCPLPFSKIPGKKNSSRNHAYHALGVSDEMRLLKIMCRCLSALFRKFGDVFSISPIEPGRGFSNFVNSKAGIARNPRGLNHKDTKDTKKEGRESVFFLCLGLAKEKASTPGGVGPIPAGICKFEQSGMD
jgi:hypothetical protein